MQAAKAFHDVKARAHPQVKGIAQNNLRAHFFKAARHYAFHGAVGTHGHEDGCLNHAVVERELTSSRMAVGVSFEEFKFKHAAIWARGC